MKEEQSFRDFFEVDAKHVAVAALYALAKEDQIKMNVVDKAIKQLGINPAKPDPVKS